LLASATVTNQYPLTGHFRYVTIPAITLQPGNYQIDGVSSTNNYTWNDTGFQTDTAITYVGNTWLSVENGAAPTFLNFVKNAVTDGFWGANLFLGAPIFVGSTIDTTQPYFLATALGSTLGDAGQ
jgi:hypothetical protein